MVETATKCVFDPFGSHCMYSQPNLLQLRRQLGFPKLAFRSFVGVGVSGGENYALTDQQVILQ